MKLELSREEYWEFMKMLACIDWIRNCQLRARERGDNNILPDESAVADLNVQATNEQLKMVAVIRARLRFAAESEGITQ